MRTPNLLSTTRAVLQDFSDRFRRELIRLHPIGQMNHAYPSVGAELSGNGGGSTPPSRIQQEAEDSPSYLPATAMP
jgi:hypothetical protein